ncbi:MAG: hypothetical protein ABSA78_03975 [Candidatus Sulfotelmatobacter sp.]|jgi:hypothetical protein
MIRGARFLRALGIGVLAITTVPALMSQQPPADSGATAVVTFTLDFPQSNPEHYSISVDAAGHARYECTGKVTDDSEEQNYKAEFEMSAANRERIFEWARQAKYFSGKIDSGNRKMAFTGTKTLSYRDGERSNASEYDYSSLEPVRQLTSLFQNIESTMEYGWRLAYYHRYQKLALDEELKSMEAQARRNELSEIQGVAPVLQEIFEDGSVINVVRARAKEMIQMGNATAGH